MQKGSGLIAVGSAASQSAIVITTGDTLFTIAGGPIAILHLQSVAITTNSGTASTLQYQSAPTVGTATTFSAASASMTSMGAGASVTLNMTALSTAPDIVLQSAGAVTLGANVGNHIIIQAGTIKAVVGTGPTAGTFKHYIAYIPLAPGVTVS
jgi:hypothetical protein